MKEKILVFIPAYNCGPQIGRVVRQFDESTRGYFKEILIVDNGSTDDTREAAGAACAELKGIQWRVVRNQENYSLGGSHKVAFNYALENGFDYCAVLHGDDQGHIRDLVKQIEEGRHRKYDCILGARFAPGSKLVGYAAFRTYGNLIFNFLCSLVLRRRVYDMGSGLNLYSAEFLRKKFYLYFPNNLTYNVFMLFYSVYIRSRFVFFPLEWREDDQISNAKIFRQAWIIVKILVRYVFGAKRLFDLRPNEYSEIDYRFETLARGG